MTQPLTQDQTQLVEHLKATMATLDHDASSLVIAVAYFLANDDDGDTAHRITDLLGRTFETKDEWRAAVWDALVGEAA